MKKNILTRVFLAIIGAVDVVWDIFLPIGLSLALVTIVKFTSFQSAIIIITGAIASFYRAIRTGWIIRE